MKRTTIFYLFYLFCFVVVVVFWCTTSLVSKLNIPILVWRRKSVSKKKKKKKRRVLSINSTLLSVAPAATLDASWGDNPSQPAATSGRGRVADWGAEGWWEWWGWNGGGLETVSRNKTQERAVGVGKEDIKF